MPLVGVAMGVGVPRTVAWPRSIGMTGSLGLPTWTTSSTNSFPIPHLFSFIRAQRINPFFNPPAIF